MIKPYQTNPNISKSSKSHEDRWICVHDFSQAALSRGSSAAMDGGN